MNPAGIKPSPLLLALLAGLLVLGIVLGVCNALAVALPASFATLGWGLLLALLGLALVDALRLRLLTSRRCAIMATNTRGMNTTVSGGMDSILIHLPPNMRRIGLRKRSAIRYMAGTIISVMKNAKIKP